jgi:hypothetical protein
LLHSRLIQFINVQKERIDRKELAEGTLYNYVKAIKLFCNMNDIMINWKKIGKGMATQRHNADDRLPTFEEIHKLLEHERPLVAIHTKHEKLLTSLNGHKLRRWEIR